MIQSMLGKAATCSSRTQARVKNPCYIALLLLSMIASISARAQTKYADVSSALNSTALQPGGQGVIAVVLDVKEGFHAQSHTPYKENLFACRVKLEENPAVEIFEPIYPPGKDETYPELGLVSVYTGRTIIYIPITIKPDAPA